MVKPADLLNNLKYDAMDSSYSHADNYLQQHNYEIHSLVNGIKLPKEHKTSKTFKNMSYDLYTVDVNSLTSFDCKFSKNWKDVPVKEKGSIFQLIANGIEKSSQIFAELESLSRNVAMQEVLKHDIPLSADHFNYHADACSSAEYDETTFKDRELLVFTEQSSLAVLGMTVSSALAVGVAVSILATEKVAAVAELFGRICINAGIPSDAMCIYIVEEQHLQKLIIRGTSDMKQESSHVFNSDSGCTVVVTESGDIDAAIDMLRSDSTCTRVYPWRTDRLFIQESVYDEFRRRLGKKFCTKSEELNHVKTTLPKGSEVWLYPKKYSDSIAQFIVSENINLGGKMDNIITMQAYRSTKELLNLVNSESPFAMSLWCDSVSVSNEIALSANTPVVWINMYGKFDPTVSTRMRQPRLIIFGGPLSYANHVREEDPLSLSGGDDDTDEVSKSDKTVEELTGKVNKLKKMLLSWSNLSHHQRRSLCLRAWRSVRKEHPKLDHEEAVNKFEKLLETVPKTESDVKIVHNKLRVYTREPVGIAMSGSLTHAITSAIEGNGVLYVNVIDENEIKMKFTSRLSEQGVPVLLCQTKSLKVTEAQALKIHEIKSIDKCDLECSVYNTRIVWSPIGETFAN